MLADMNAKQVKGVAGNAMHVPTIGSLLVWTVANLEKTQPLVSGGGGEPPASKRRRC